MTGRLAAIVVWVVFLCGGLVWTSGAWAARPGRVDVEGAEVYEGPGSSFKVVDKLPKGTPLAVSNVATEGFFKVRTPSGAVGFMSAEVLVMNETPAGAPPADTGPFSEIPSTTVAAREAPTRKYVRFRFLGGLNFFSVGDVNTLFNFDELKLGFHGGMEFNLLLKSDIALVVRFERIFKTVVATDSVSRKSFQLDLNSTPVTTGVELLLSKDKKFFTQFVILGGLGIQTGLTSTALNEGAPNLTGYLDHAFTAMAKINGNWTLNKTWFFFGELGYRVLKTRTMASPGVAGAGQEAFKANNVFVPIALDLSGPFAGFGLAVSL